MTEKNNEQRETAVKCELLNPGLIPTEPTLASPACSSLSADDALPAITSVSATLLRLDYEMKTGFHPLIEREDRKYDNVYINNRIHYWTRRFKKQFRCSSGDFKSQLAVIGLFQATHIQKKYSDRHTYPAEEVANMCLQHIHPNYRLCWGKLFYNKRNNSFYDEQIESSVKLETLIEQVVSSKLLYLTSYSICSDRIHTRRFVRCHMLRTILSEVSADLEKKLSLPPSIESFLDDLPDSDDDDDSDTRWNKYSYNSARWTEHLTCLMQDSYIQAECQSLFDISISPNEEGFKQVFENIKSYISEQFGAKLALCRDIVVNVTVLLLLWYIVSHCASYNRKDSWAATILSFLSGMVVIVCLHTAAGVIARCISQILTYIRGPNPAFDTFQEGHDEPGWERKVYENWYRTRDPPHAQEDDALSWNSKTYIHPSFLAHEHQQCLHAELQIASPNERLARIGGLLSLATIATLTGKEKWTASYFAKQIAMLPRFVAGITSLVDIAQDCFKLLHKEIMVDILGYAPLDESGEHPQIERFNALMQLICEGDKGNLIQNSTVLQSYVLEAEQLGLKILQTPGLGEYRSAISAQYQLLRRMYERLGLRGVSSRGQRLAPIVIQLYGETGQGKSSIVTTLATKLLARICDREQINKTKVNIRDLLYARNVEQEFWDGYHGQLVCVFDDFAQKRDFAQEPNPELFEIIRAGNTFPYALHMADLVDKNTTTFQSRIIILTTNAKTPKIESLYAPEAFFRRVDLSYEVKIRPEFGEVFKVGQKCVTRLADEYKQNYDPSRQSFTPFRIDTGRNTGTPTDLDGVVDAAFAQYNERFNFEQSRQNFDQSLARELGFVQAESQVWPLDYFTQTINKVQECPEFIRFKENLVLYKEKCEQIKQRLQAKLQQHSTVLKALGILGVALSVYKLGSMLTSFVKPKLGAAESAYAARPLVVRQSAYSGKLARHRTALKKATKATSEAYDQTCRDVLISYAKRGLYHVSVDDHPFGNGFFITGKIFVMPRHFLTQMNIILNQNSEAKIQLKGLHTSYVMKASDVDPINIFDDENVPDPSYVHDCVAFKFLTADSHRNMIKHFMSRQDQMKIEKVGVVMAHINYQNKEVSAEYSSCRAEATYRSKTSKECVYSEFPSEEEDEKFYTRDFWRYALPTTKGDCGSLLAVNHPMAKAKLVGMHIMGIPTKDEGYSVALYSDDLEAISKFFDDVDTMPCPEHEVKAEMECLPFKGEFHPLGISPTPFKQVTQSKICKSELHPDNAETWRDAISCPALLHPVIVREEDGIPAPNGTKFDPFIYRLEKHGKAAQCVDQRILDMVTESYINELRNVCQKHKYPKYRSAYSFEEAVLGIDGDPYVNSINRTTAPGYGWNRGTIPGKKKWFGQGDEFDLSLAEPVKERCAEVISLARQNQRYPHVFIDTLKDERKPRQKWWKTRVFSACSMDYYIACKQYYQGVVGLLTRHRVSTGLCVGINVYSTEWDECVKHLQRCSPFMCAGDFENYDASLLSQILEKTRDVLNALARDLDGFDYEHEKIRNVLFADLVNSTHLARDVLYQWTHSLPSGHFLTAICNSLYTNIAFRYLLAKVSGLTSYLEIHKLLLKFKMISYGDDHVIALVKEYLPVFNQNTLPELFASIGMTYTDEQKTGETLPDYRPIEQVTFLKRGFRWEPKLNRYVAPLSLDTVLETPFWFKKNIEETKTTESNVTWAIQELALHDDDIFKFWTTKIRLVCRDVLNWMPDLSPNRCEYIQQLESSFDTLF